MSATHHFNMLPQPLTLDTTCLSLISLGEEYTDKDMQEDSHHTPSNDNPYYSPISPDDDEYDDLSPEYAPLWQEEHQRLIHLHTAVLDDERAARDSEILLESQVARIKDDLARLRGGYTSHLSQAQEPPRCHPSQCLFPISSEEAALSSILTEAREARALQRQNRKLQRERIRELGVLLTLGTEVRKWEERLSSPFSSPCTPSLSSSPLWRVSAEMILRRRSLSERPRQLLSRPTPAPCKPSSLKWAFTLDDLRDEESDSMDIDLPDMVIDKEEHIDSDTSSSDSDSGDSAKSSSEEGSDADQTTNKRRGRARFSWRKSLTSLQAMGLQAQLNAMQVDS